MPWLRKWLGLSPTRPDEPRETDWVRVVTAPNRMMAGLLEGALEEEGIPFYASTPGLQSIFTSAGNQQNILVPVEYEERARELLEGIWQEEETGDDGGDDG